MELGTTAPCKEEGVSTNNNHSLTSETQNYSLSHLYILSARSSAWEDTDVKWDIGVPLPVLAALLEPVNVAHLWDHGE